MAYTSPNASLLKINGEFGSTFVNDTTLYSGSYFAIQAFDDVVFNVLTATNIDNISQFTSMSIVLPQGGTIYGNITSVKLASGSAFLFKH